jgi:hypothetical protein
MLQNQIWDVWGMNLHAAYCIIAELRQAHAEAINGHWLQRTMQSTSTRAACL